MDREDFSYWLCMILVAASTACTNGATLGQFVLINPSQATNQLVIPIPTDAVSEINSNRLYLVTSSTCSYCNTAKQRLTENGLVFKSQHWDTLPQGVRMPFLQQVQALSSGSLLVPYVFVCHQYYGDLSSIQHGLQNGDLMRRLQAC